jgi:hypothetical protein
VESKARERIERLNRHAVMRIKREREAEKLAKAVKEEKMA